jgi:hypothetical protein
MSIEQFPGSPQLTRAPSPNWGELSPDGQTAVVVRFALGDGWASFPSSEFRRWDHAIGEPETLTIKTRHEEIIVEGLDLTAIRAALDLGRLCELRVNFPRPQGARPGPQVRRITIEPI